MLLKRLQNNVRTSHIKNDRENGLVEFCIENKMKTANTLFDNHKRRCIYTKGLSMHIIIKISNKL